MEEHGGDSKVGGSEDMRGIEREGEVVILKLGRKISFNVGEIFGTQSRERGMADVKSTPKFYP